MGEEEDRSYYCIIQVLLEISRGQYQVVEQTTAEMETCFVCLPIYPKVGGPTEKLREQADENEMKS